MSSKLHEHGIVTTCDGSILIKSHTELYDEVAIIVDRDVDCLVKVENPSWVQGYFDAMVHRIRAINPQHVEGLTYIKFNLKTGDKCVDTYFKIEFSADEICTLINYFANSIGSTRINQILNLDANALHIELKKLADIGF